MKQWIFSFIKFFVIPLPFIRIQTVAYKKDILQLHNMDKLELTMDNRHLSTNKLQHAIEKLMLLQKTNVSSIQDLEFNCKELKLVQELNLPSPHIKHSSQTNDVKEKDCNNFNINDQILYGHQDSASSLILSSLCTNYFSCTNQNELHCKEEGGSVVDTFGQFLELHKELVNLYNEIQASTSSKYDLIKEVKDKESLINYKALQSKMDISNSILEDLNGQTSTIQSTAWNNVINLASTNITLCQFNADLNYIDDYITRIEESSKKYTKLIHEMQKNLKNEQWDHKDYDYSENEKSKEPSAQIAFICKAYKQITDLSLVRQQIITQHINSINDELEIVNGIYISFHQSLDLPDISVNHEIEQQDTFPTKQYFLFVSKIFELFIKYEYHDFTKNKIFYITQFRWVKHRFK